MKKLYEDAVDHLDNEQAILFIYERLVSKTKKIGEMLVKNQLMQAHQELSRLYKIIEHLKLSLDPRPNQEVFNSLYTYYEMINDLILQIIIDNDLTIYQQLLSSLTRMHDSWKIAQKKVKIGNSDSGVNIKI